MSAETIKTAARVFVIPLEATEEPYAIISLHGKYGQGKVAKVSLQDVARVRRHKWYVTDRGYAATYILKRSSFKKLLMHRFLIDAPEGAPVDHVNRDKLDYRRSNLRLCDHKGNAQNRSIEKGKALRFKNVSWISQAKKYRASIRVDDKNVVLGEYDDSVYAAKLYDACARYHFGDFAATNFEGTEKLNAFEVRARFLENRKWLYTSPYVGVFAQNGGMFRAYLNVEKIRYSVSSFISEEEAAKVRDALARFYLGDKAVTNFEGLKTMSYEQAQARCRYLAYKEGKRASRYKYVTPKAGGWSALVRFKNGKTVLLRKYFQDELEAARAVDDVCAAYGLPRVNFPDELRVA